MSISMLAFLACAAAAAKLALPVHSISPANQVFSHLTRLPHLEFTNRKSFFLRSDEPWRPSRSTLVTALMSDKPMTIRFEPDLHSVTANNKEPIAVYLKYKCETMNPVYNEVQLVSGKKGTNQTLCPETRTFRISHVPNTDSMFNLTLLRNHNVPFAEAMTHMLEFQLRAELLVGSFQSACLFVYNLDALTNLNSTSSGTVMVNGIEFNNSFMTHKAMEFFTTLSPANDTVAIQKLTLFTPSFTAAFHAAPVFVRYTITISVIMRANRRCTDPYDSRIAGDMIFSTGDPDPAALELAAKHYNAFIDLEKNFLMFSTSSIASHRNFFAVSFQNKPIDLCLRISLNNPVWDYQLMLTLSSNIQSSAFSVLPGVIEKKECAADRNFRWVILFEGMRNVVIFNRIVCHEMDKEVAIVTLDGKECRNFIAGSTIQWQHCEDGYEISQTGRVIKILGPVSRKHAGNYRFLLTKTIYMLVVSVMSLPTFNTPQYTGALPHTSYAVLDTQVTFNCSIYHDGMRHVNLVPVFRTLDLFKDFSYKELNLDDFATRVLQTSPRAIKIKMTENLARGYRSNMILTLPHVMRHWRTWLLQFACRAYLPIEDARIMGIPDYYTETNTDVEFIGKRIFYKHSHSSCMVMRSTVAAVCLAIFAKLYMYIYLW